ncbi:hypothetical protein RFI_01735 [Reticulomyxa filosa]|uniref:Uncharacterized protein n=1 Tax=Reticulomyxa filosa TaxID=46433 RepID=X6PB24_RETFI|nr:hypothetical protein RFI_01735 [Reticulomyxa filosa]|eukprot:ETO35328.1 hypothetical protein RFI_01735 [Reticulomyxa filosa]
MSFVDRISFNFFKIKQNDTKLTFIRFFPTVFQKTLTPQIKIMSFFLREGLPHKMRNLEETLTKLEACQNELVQAKQDLANEHQLRQSSYVNPTFQSLICTGCVCNYRECCQLVADNSKFQNEICHMTTLKNTLTDELEKVKLHSAKLQEFGHLKIAFFFF